MRLFQVLTLEQIQREAGMEVVPPSQTTVLISTDEKYKDVPSFLAHATKKEHGAKYAGKTWKLLSERAESDLIPVVQAVSYEAVVNHPARRRKKVVHVTAA